MRRARRAALYALGAMSAVAIAACDSGNTGVLDLFPGAASGPTTPTGTTPSGSKPPPATSRCDAATCADAAPPGKVLGCSLDGGCAAACTTSAACPSARPVCDPSDGQCVECLPNTDCSHGGRCDPVTRTCSSSCQSDADCKMGSDGRCLTSTNQCVECLGANDCQSGDRPICNTTSHACVGCVHDADCTDAQKPACLASSGQCAECSATVPCSSGATCDTSQGQCN